MTSDPTLLPDLRAWLQEYADDLLASSCVADPAGAPLRSTMDALDAEAVAEVEGLVARLDCAIAAEAAR